jgi:hypothetical protein
MTPSHSTNELNAAFAAALDELIPKKMDSYISVLTDYHENRRHLIAKAARGDYATGGGGNVPMGIIYGTYGVTLEQYRAIHMLIYQDNSRWAWGVTQEGNHT